MTSPRLPLARLLRPTFMLLGLSAALLLAACDIGEDPNAIDTRPTFAVRYATARVSPAVVQLDVLTEEFSNGASHPSNSIGSGFIIDNAGHVLTNFHVAGRAKRIDITLGNQEHVRAKLVGSDHWTDLAVVQLDMDEIARRKLTFNVATLGNSSAVQLGEPVMAVGTPYGLSRTVTAGIISNTDRFFDETNIDGYETGWFNNWLQMDAAINPGNSGGPLINLKGEVIGINTRGYSEANNLGFAIPIDTAKEVAKIILEKGAVSRSYIGVTLKPLQDLEKFYDLPGNQGVLVENIERQSPAQVAGLHTEDIILEVNGTPVSARFPEQLAAVRKLISSYPVGEKIDLTVRRGTTVRTISTTASRPATTSAPATTRTADTKSSESRTISVTTETLESTFTEEHGIPAWGLTVRNLTRAYLRQNLQPPMAGVLVTGTSSGSAAERSDLKRGDIILSIDDKKVANFEELSAAVDVVMKDLRKNPREVPIEIYRGRGLKPLTINP